MMLMIMTMIGTAKIAVYMTLRTAQYLDDDCESLLIYHHVYIHV